MFEVKSTPLLQMATQDTCVEQNDRDAMEDHDTSMTNLVNISWNKAEDTTNLTDENQPELEGQQAQQVGVSTDVRNRRLDESSTPQRSNCVVSASTSEERDLSCSTHREPTKEQGARNTRRCRRYNSLTGDRPSHRRRSIHDMTKPLRSWLYNHKENPYPTKNDKLTLSASSEMTLVQVSNWFANARRRLKNTAGQAGPTWKNRIKLYNKQAQDSDQLSVASSRSGESEGEMPVLSLRECRPFNTQTSNSPSNNISQSSTMPSTATRAEPRHCLRPPPSSQIEVFTTETAHLHKFKQNILHRYLHDSVQHQQLGLQYGASLQSGTRTPSTVRVFNNRDPLGSTGDFEDVSSTSPNSTGSDGNRSIFQVGRAPDDVDFPSSSVSQTFQSEEILSQTTERNDTHWKELVAAMVLTNMARAKRHLLPLGMMT